MDNYLLVFITKYLLGAFPNNFIDRDTRIAPSSTL